MRLASSGTSGIDAGVSRRARTRTRPGGTTHPRPSTSVARVRTPGPLVLDTLVWLVFAVLFVGAALLVKVAAALLVVLIVLALLLGLVLRALRKRRARRPGTRHPRSRHPR